MDSKHAVPRNAGRVAAVCGLLASIFASFASASSCTVEQLVLRDGIVSLPAPANPPDTGLDLISLGTITETTHNSTYSIWRVRNNSATSYRAQLQAPGGERVPLLVRAHSEITLRSDSLDGAAPHSLIVDNSPVDQAALASTTFSDPREFSGADCMFDGNPLYAAEHAGTLKISTVHGAVITEIPGTGDLSAVALEHPNEKIWTLRGSTLSTFDFAGEETRVLTLPFAAPAGASGRQRLAIDYDNDNVWIAIGPTLYRLSAGQVVGSVTYGEEIREISIDGRTWVWVLLGSDVHVVKGRDPISEVAHIVLPAAASAMVYDPYWGQMRIMAGSSLLRYDDEAVLSENLTVTTPQTIEQLAADGAGGVWAASANRLFQVQVDGSVSIEVEPFATGTAIVDLASDPADGTAWVATGSRIRHFGRDGTLVHDLLPTPAGGGARQFRFLELFADRTPPNIRIIVPAEGATVTTSRPTLELEYWDSGSRGIAQDTLELSLAGQMLPADCDIGLEVATCVPAVDLPQGEVSIRPRIFDLAGNESGDRRRTFTVQSGASPQILVTYPNDNLLTRLSSVTVTGSVVQATGLTLNAAPVALDSAGAFSHEVVLVEGQNVLTLVATGVGGLSAELQIPVVRDSLPPAAPNMALISVGVDEEAGNLLVSAPSGTFEPFARVRVLNQRTGSVTEVAAAANGSFSATVPAVSGDRLFITVGDVAGNEREQVELHYASEVNLVISSPSGSVTVNSRDLIIRGTVTGPLNTNVTANGILAAISANRDFVVRVPLAAGQNVIQIIATAPGQTAVTRQVIATRDGDAPFSIAASALQGPAPLAVEFRVQRFDTTTRIERVEVDFQDDGVMDVVSVGSRVGSFLHQYTVPGNYTVVFRIRINSTTQFTYQVPVVVTAAEDRDSHVQATWQRFANALAAGDTTTALSYMTESAAVRYASVLTDLQSSLPQIVSTFSALNPAGNSDGAAEYVLVRDIDGQLTAFLIYFIQGGDGVWRIAGM